jgi:hypothetical protein
VFYQVRWKHLAPRPEGPPWVETVAATSFASPRARSPSPRNAPASATPIGRGVGLAPTLEGGSTSGASVNEAIPVRALADPGRSSQASAAASIAVLAVTAIGSS